MIGQMCLCAALASPESLVTQPLVHCLLLRCQRRVCQLSFWLQLVRTAKEPLRGRGQTEGHMFVDNILQQLKAYTDVCEGVGEQVPLAYPWKAWNCMVFCLQLVISGSLRSVTFFCVGQS